MLLRGTIRICCLVVMAPALVKAVNILVKYSLQIDSFNSTHCVIYCLVNVCLIDLIGFAALPVESTGRYIFCFWILFSPHPSKIDTSDGWRSKDRSHPNGVGDCAPIFCNLMMNRDISPVRDSMGLLSANTSLDSDFKVRPSLEHQSAFGTVERELLVMSPRELEDPSDLTVFGTVSNDVDRRPPTPPESRPGSVPMGGLNTPAAELKKIESRTAALKRRAENLIRRLRRLEAESVEFHVTRQLRAFVDHQQKSLGISCQKKAYHLSNRGIKDSNIFKTEFLQNEDVRNLSTAALVKLVRKLESRETTKLLSLHKGILLDVENRVNNEKVILKFNSEVSTEMNRTAGTLISNLKHLEFCMDSDVTESSSGGESCSEDEDDGSVGKKNTPPSIHKRAEWKWAVNRTAVARRWIWLQAQVSDLEYRIRQQNEIYCQLRASKHCVLLEDNVSSTTENFNSSNLSSDVNIQSIKKKGDLSYLSGSSSKNIGNNLPLVNKHLKSVNGFFDSGTNGYHSVCGVLSANSNSGQGSEQRGTQSVNNSLSHIYDSVHNSCRTRPVKSFKKRKLYRTAGLHLINKKVSGLSTVKCNCNCQCEISSCAMCGGRYNNLQTVDEDKPVFERIAILDPSFHPVLSFNHVMTDSKCVECRTHNAFFVAELPFLFTPLLEVVDQKKEMFKYKWKSHYSLPKSLNYQAKKHSFKLARNAAQTLLSSAKFRKNFCGRKHGTCKKLVASKKRRGKIGRRKQHDFDLLLPQRKRKYRRRSLSVASSGSSKPSSPIPGSSYTNVEAAGGIYSNGRPSILQDMLRRRRGESAFDIDNIVIPYSIASSTRVEKLQYKEIITPKWRLIDETVADMEENGGKIKSEEMEDTSDASYAERHQICEIEEKKKFATSYTKNKGMGRSRSRSRGDRADSSGANTPDPLSPHQLDILGQDSNSGLAINASSPINVLPSTSIPLFFEDSQSSVGTPCFRTERKRTMSLSKRERSEEMQWEADEMYEAAAPYEPYVFPLPDDLYNKMLDNSPHLTDHVVAPSESFARTPVSQPASPLSSTDSESLPEEDPSDPEWTVISERGSHQSLVLKLAKR
ncbi:KAT8 regulatory NSL complex subunit 1-like [Centruroides sculpturatus]|uniref:KAT8 regulatory NSL complex subunit 1-like n=1 Tax=Centruroides sculpturatus TaxID=218467 RepID=UPI000C6DDB3B|nr:KAT8 regulatory NSL complex subunit 1-like [Centruroides sculpturatus]